MTILCDLSLVPLILVDGIFLKFSGNIIMNNYKKPLSLALSTTLLTGLVIANASAETNNFEITELSTGYMQLAEVDKTKEGKCGEAKCGANKEKAAKNAEAKCGEAKCGANKEKAAKNAEAKCGEAKCGANKEKAAKNAEAKCGEAKCGSNKK